MTADIPLPVSAIVLAGGRSARFGRDKLVARLDGRPLLDHAVDAVRAVARDVVIVAAPGADLDLPTGCRLIHDDAPFEGPLAGCLAGLTVVREPLVLVVGGDMPSLVPDVLRSLVRALESPAADLAALEFRGRRQQLPIALRTAAGTAAARRLLGDGERRMSALAERLHVRAVAEGDWRALDRDARTLRDVDEPGDLAVDA